MHHASHVSKLGRYIPTVLANFFSRGFGISPDEFADINGFCEHVCGMAWLRHLGHDGSCKLKNVLAAKQEDVEATLLQLVIVKGIIVRLPAQLRNIEIGWNAEAAAQLKEFLFVQGFAFQTQPNRFDRVRMLAEPLICPARRLERLTRAGWECQAQPTGQSGLPSHELPFTAAISVLACFNERPSDADLGSHEMPPLIPGWIPP